MTDTNPTAPPSAEPAPQPSHHGLLGTVGDLMLAGIGVVDMLAEGPRALYQHSVERGADRVQCVWDHVPHGRRLRRLPARLAGKGEGSNRISAEIEAAVGRMNVPTTADIELLTQQIAELEAKISQLGQT